MSKLYALPNGTWIDPNTVKAIIALPEKCSSFTGVEPYPARVAIYFMNGHMEINPCYSLDEAVSVRDRIAEEINALRE